MLIFVDLVVRTEKSNRVYTISSLFETSNEYPNIWDWFLWEVSVKFGFKND